MSVFEHVVTEAEDKTRIDKLLSVIDDNLSRSKVQAMLRRELVTVNGQMVKANYKCNKNDFITWSMPEEKEQVTIQPENIAIDIVYEDEHVLVVNKPKGMVVHPNEQTTTGTLVNALLFHCQTLSTIAGPLRPGIVHRIDKDTSGLLVVAKDNEAHRKLVHSIMNKQVKREYEAIVHGVLDHDAGMIDAPIARDPKNRLRMKVVENGKSSITHFQVNMRFNNYTYITCRLETGRTHQIRVHMEYIGHPLVGDPKYSSSQSRVKGQVLYAKRLAFIHPIKEERMEFEIDKPLEFKTVVAQLEKMT